MSRLTEAGSDLNGSIFSPDEIRIRAKGLIDNVADFYRQTGPRSFTAVAFSLHIKEQFLRHRQELALGRGNNSLAEELEAQRFAISMRINRLNFEAGMDGANGDNPRMLENGILALQRHYRVNRLPNPHLQIVRDLRAIKRAVGFK